MTIGKTQQFLYFQNKAKHYDTIRHMKASVDDQMPRRYLPNNKTVSPKKRFVPYNRQCELEVQNQNMVKRIEKIRNSQRTEVSVQGSYSRYHQVERKFRSCNPYKDQLSRTIEIANEAHESRLKTVRPKVGSNLEWNRHFGKTLDLKKNMSRYLSSNRSKGTLHIEADKFLPGYYESFVDKAELKELESPKDVYITKEAILTLPNIHSNKKIARNVRHSHHKLMIDRSRSSLAANKNTHSSQEGPMAKTSRREQLDASFSNQTSVYSLQQLGKESSVANLNSDSNEKSDQSKSKHIDSFANPEQTASGQADHPNLNEEIQKAAPQQGGVKGEQANQSQR